MALWILRRELVMQGKAEKRGLVRAKAIELANLLYDTMPSSRERSLALTKIEEAVMWASAGIDNQG